MLHVDDVQMIDRIVDDVTRFCIWSTTLFNHYITLSSKVM